MSDSESYIANGELGEVIAVEEKYIVAKLDNPERIIRIPIGKQREESEDSDQGGDGGNSDKSSTGCNFELGYAISCHRSQGSEWPLTIVMLDEYGGARMVCSREWIYTAVSRAKKLCLLIGKMQTAHGFTRRLALGKRKTFLAQLIQQEVAKCQQP